MLFHAVDNVNDNNRLTKEDDSTKSILSYLETKRWTESIIQISYLAHLNPIKRYPTKQTYTRILAMN